ncbi:MULTISPECIES: helix-turn-helix transcriptional regulator [Streptomyces]|uniref:Regulatory protein n=1 Tax=Streptomyces albus (strain ATCC 21838 / DSM 41398 / FERM P-419 / JCM 4703 / NBRC 107858) TaxID=1081613 RepID=A0A0B5EWE7_STRA4|nr:helix-turn-helix transcriptional regulator [Streptomyces sp. SCSIO ZS0520]AJE83550.1 regulatory protein [Streptomyces albus]AOU77858.1 regulatory protein [Streptomyces albus]AYN33617.1 DNA-binding response regulator [Streptomyces albus]
MTGGDPAAPLAGTAAHGHDPAELCPEGAELYGRALREGRVTRQAAARVPCLAEARLLAADPEDPGALRPTPPAVALPRLLLDVSYGIADRRGQAERLAAEFAPLMALGSEGPRPGTGGDARTGGGTGGTGTAGYAVPAPALTVHEGFERINAAIDEAVGEARTELLSIQPGGTRAPATLAQALARDRELLARGARMRTLYQHTARHDPSVHDYYALLEGDAEVRTLDEVTERLVMFDRRVAFIPASKDRTVALEVRHRTLLDYFVMTFERLWRLATPMYPASESVPSADGITARQRAIAALLVEGETDDRIAERLGLNVRTCRAHIARLAAVLGSRSRAQLGYLIGRSGILDQRP